MKRKVILIAALFSVALLLTLLEIRERQLEIRLVNNIVSWDHNIIHTSRVVLSNCFVTYEFSRHNEAVDFYLILSKLNPFLRNGFAGSEIVNIAQLDSFASANYYIGNYELFSLRIYSVPEYLALPGLERLHMVYNGRRFVVVLHDSGWFGGFADCNTIGKIKRLLEM